MTFKSIIAVDPSGSFSKTDKGGTGFAMLTESGKVITKTIWAKNYESKDKYYRECLKALRVAKTSTLVVIEDFRLQSAKARAQSNDQMQTSELIGRMEQTLSDNEIKFKRQQNTIKSRWRDALLRKELFEEFKFDMFKVSRHEKDALRHLAHAYWFTQYKEI